LQVGKGWEGGGQKSSCVPGLVTQLGVLRALEKKVMAVILLGETNSATFLTHHHSKLRILQQALQKTELKLNNFM